MLLLLDADSCQNELRMAKQQGMTVAAEHLWQSLHCSVPHPCQCPGLACLLAAHRLLLPLLAVVGCGLGMLLAGSTLRLLLRLWLQSMPRLGSQRFRQIQIWNTLSSRGMTAAQDFIPVSRSAKMAAPKLTGSVATAAAVNSTPFLPRSLVHFHYFQSCHPPHHQLQQCPL